MITIRTYDGVMVFGLEAAVRGMRNPMNSWDKSDSGFNDAGRFELGSNDISLMKKLVRAGSDHRKFMRMMTVCTDICAPLYWWKEFDTYKVGTVANSTSTMHKIHSRDFVIDDFSHEHLFGLDGEGVSSADCYQDVDPRMLDWCGGNALWCVIRLLNFYRAKFVETGDKKYWWQMIQLLPSSYNQLRTVMMNYEVLYNIYHARREHKLDEWRDFCKWAEGLPYAKELIVVENDD